MKDIAKWIIGLGLATTLVLPKRQTASVINAGSGFATGVLSTAMGTNIPQNG